MSSLQTIIDQTILLSQQAHSSLTKEDWDAFANIENQRQQLIKQIDVSSLPENEVEHVREKLTRLANLNHELEQFCSKSKQEAATQLQQFRHSKKVDNAYRNT